MAGTKTLITADQFESMSFPDEVVELVQGELIRMSPPGAEHGLIATQLGRLLADFTEKRGLGVVFAHEVGFRLDEHTVRAPDVSFISQARVAAVGIPKGFWPGAPDLAVEIQSPGDSLSDLLRKVQEYFAAGCRLVWAVFPEVRQVYVYRSPKDVQVLEEGDSLSGDEVLPGFSLPVARIFQPSEARP